MPRTLKVRGVKGRLVTDPHALVAKRPFIRYIGQKPIAGAEVGIHPALRLEPCVAEIEQEASIVRALQRGELDPMDETTAMLAGRPVVKESASADRPSKESKK